MSFTMDCCAAVSAAQKGRAVFNAENTVYDRFLLSWLLFPRPNFSSQPTPRGSFMCVDQQQASATDGIAHPRRRGLGRVRRFETTVEEELEEAKPVQFG